MDKPIFILGLPRSGSTVWLNVIGRSAGICRIAEIHFLDPWRKDFRYFCRTRIGDLTRDENVKKMVDLVFATERIQGISSWFWTAQIRRIGDKGLKESIHTRILASDRSLGCIFRILIEQITASKGYDRCCAKFPVYPNHIPDLLQWYPNCRIVHITRDPRATAISKTNDPGGTQKLMGRYPGLNFAIRKLMILFVIGQYIWTSRIHRRYQHLDNYALFRYEDLLVDPEGTIRKLCDFAEVDFSPGMLSLKSAQTSSVTGGKKAGIDRQAGMRWRRVISPMEEWFVSSTTRRAMARFGFDPNTHPLYLPDSSTMCRDVRNI